LFFLVKLRVLGVLVVRFLSLFFTMTDDESVLPVKFAHLFRGKLYVTKNAEILSDHVCFQGEIPCRRR
jgi:hypothetical protein